MPQETISYEQYQARLQTAEQGAAGMRLNKEEPDDTSILGQVLGVGVQIGGVEIPPITAEVWALLAMIESPWMSDSMGEDQQIELLDAASALYVIAFRTQAAKPLIGMKRRLDMFEKRIRPMVEKQPALFDRYMKGVDEIVASASAEFETAALEFWGHVNASLIEVIEGIGQLIQDAVEGLSTLPDDAKKKAAVE